MNNKIIIYLGFLIIGALMGAGIFYLAAGVSSNKNHQNQSEGQLWTCGMHPDIITDEPGTCPICGMNLVPKKGTGTTATGERKILYYRSPMNPSVTSPDPMKDEMGMDYVAVYENGNGSEGVVSIDPVVMQNMNVKTVKVEKRELNSTVVTNGILTTNEMGDYVVSTRVDGWVEKLYINFIGQKVKKGDKLLEIYSPALVTAQQELLTAISYQKATSNSNLKDVLNSGNELINNAMRKLQLLEMSDTEIERVKTSKEVNTYITLYAQKDGTVILKNIIEGQKIMPGMSLLQVSNLTSLWLTADIYEYELVKIALGSKAEIKFNFMPGKTFIGKISFIYPTIDEKTRTAKIRIDISNNDNLLKPAMLANVVIQGVNLGSFPVIPENAVLRGGKKDIVILSLGNGKFKPQEIKLGDYSQGFYQVLSGLSEGTDIVSSAQFMIDSESNLNAAVSQYTSSNSEQRNNSQNTDSKEKDIKLKKNEQMDKQAEEIKKHESIVREGMIDLESIDINKDGKVFQDPMDWNVISEQEGRCPLCNMKLQEVSLDEARKNLVEHGYKVM